MTELSFKNKVVPEPTAKTPETRTDPPNTEMSSAAEPDDTVPETYMKISTPIEEVLNALRLMTPWFGVELSSESIGYKRSFAPVPVEPEAISLLVCI